MAQSTNPTTDGIAGTTGSVSLLAAALPTFVASLYPPSDVVVVECTLDSKDGIASFFGPLRSCPGLASIVEQYRYARIDTIQVQLWGTEQVGSAIVAFSDREFTSKDMNVAALFRCSNSTSSNFTALTQGNSKVEMKLMQGLSSQLTPPPFDGAMPSIAVLIDAPSKRKTFVKVSFEVRVGGQRVIRADF